MIKKNNDIIVSQMQEREKVVNQIKANKISKEKRELEQYAELEHKIFMNDTTPEYERHKRMMHREKCEDLIY